MKIIILLLSIIIFSFIGCNTNEHRISKYESAIPISQKFLVHEWMIDSIYGSTEFVQDWIYFTPENKFWRFSEIKENYLIDSSYQYNESEIEKNGETKYSIYSLDSNTILLVTDDNQVFRCRRWNEFDPEDITRFLGANPIKKLINGNWILDSLEIQSASITSSCDKLAPMSRFFFRKDGILELFPNDSINKCADFSYQIFKNGVTLRSGDMMINGLEILKLTNSYLILKSTLVSHNDWSEPAMLARRNGYNMYFHKQ